MNIPIYTGLTERIMLGGIPRNIAISGATIALAVVLGLQRIAAIPIIIIAYYILLFLYKADSYFIEIILKHINEDDILFP